MNHFQKALAKKFRKYKKELEALIAEEEAETKAWIKGSASGTEVVIDTWGTFEMQYVISTKDHSWQHTNWTIDRQKLLEMIKENGWILFEPEAVQ